MEMVVCFEQMAAGFCAGRLILAATAKYWGLGRRRETWSFYFRLRGMVF